MLIYQVHKRVTRHHYPTIPLPKQVNNVVRYENIDMRNCRNRDINILTKCVPLSLLFMIKLPYQNWEDD